MATKREQKLCSLSACRNMAILDLGVLLHDWQYQYYCVYHADPLIKVLNEAIERSGIRKRLVEMN